MMKTLKCILGAMIAGALAAPAVLYVARYVADGRTDLYHYGIVGAVLYFFCPVFVLPELWVEDYVALGLFYQAITEHVVMNTALFGMLF